MRTAHDGWGVSARARWIGRLFFSSCAPVGGQANGQKGSDFFLLPLRGHLLRGGKGRKGESQSSEQT